MGTSVGGGAVAGALESNRDGSGRPPQAPKREFTEPKAHRAALDAPINNLLLAAAERASEQLKIKWPKRCAATLHVLTRAVPALAGSLIALAAFTRVGTLVTSILAMLPIAFRLWCVVRPVAAPADPWPPFPATLDEELPVYSVIVPLRGEARVVDQLLSGIERLNYPADKLDVILAVEADDHEFVTLFPLAGIVSQSPSFRFHGPNQARSQKRSTSRFPSHAACSR